MAPISLQRFKIGLLTRMAESMPWSVLRRLVARETKGMRMAFCLHRVGNARRENEAVPNITVPETVLDEFVENMDAAKGDTRWLTYAFDDGYADAAEYVASRAPEYPNIEWLFFVCPKKIRDRVGFRWDAYERKLDCGEQPPSIGRFVETMDADYERELLRQDLRAAAEQDEFALATRQQLLELSRNKNVTLGNHTNSHLIGALPIDQAYRDFVESTEQFEEMFGSCRQFAFPFGVPGKHFRKEHVEFLRKLRPLVMWTTEPLPYLPEHRKPGAVLPRVVIDGLWSAKTLALWVALLGRKMPRVTQKSWLSATLAQSTVGLVGRESLLAMDQLVALL